MGRAMVTQILLCTCCFISWATNQELVNVATNKTYSQISNYRYNGAASKAADGNTAGSFTDKTCSHTNSRGEDGIPGNQNHWWEVDLGRTFPVHNITVWARTHFSDRLYPFNITVDGQTCVRMVSDPGTRHHSVRCTSQMYGQVVRLTLMNKRKPLNLCELQIFVPSGVSQCPAGHHGAQCGQNCSDNCGGGPGNNFCYQDTGVCYDGCRGNFAGNFCKECKGDFTGEDCTACPDGVYGPLCNETCSPGCARCDQLSGNCTACDTDLVLPRCTGRHDPRHASWVVPVVSAAIGVVLIIVVIMAVVCWRRRSRAGPEENYYKNASPGEPGSTQGNVTADRPASTSAAPGEDNTYYEIRDTVPTHYDSFDRNTINDDERTPYMELAVFPSEVMTPAKAE